MTIFEGSYKLESSDGLAAGFAAMGNLYLLNVLNSDKNI